MTVGKVLLTGLKIIAVCLVFAVSFMLGATLSGLNRIGQQAPPSKTVQQVQQVSPSQEAIPSVPAAPAKPQHPQMPGNFLRSLLIYSVCAGIVLSYLILRSSWHGWTLVGGIGVSMYGVSTVAAQVESVFFLSNKLPSGMIQAIFLQGAISVAVLAPIAVSLLGKWRADSSLPASPVPARMRVSTIASRLAILVIAFVFLYMFFGYYVAWRSPAVRQYYEGPEYSSFYGSLKANWTHNPWIYPLQIFRALLYAACLYPLIRMLRTARWEAGVAMAFFLSVWTTVLLLPNPMMPSNVAHTHFWETLGFSLAFGALAGGLLSTPGRAASARVAAA
jgi:hypothetical protein